MGVWVFFAGASAQAMQLSPQQKADMKLHYDKATRAYDVGKYQEAIEEYQKAYEIGGDAAMIYNIAQAYRLSDQLSEAIRFYRRYLQRSPSAPNREIVERRIAELEKVVDERKKAGAPMVPVAPTPMPTPTPVSPIASPPTPPPPTVPPPAITEPTPVIPLEPAPVQSGNRTAHFVVGAVLLGVGAILGGASIWQGKIAQEKADKLSSESQSAGSVYFNPAVETNGKNANLVAIVLGSFSAATIVAGGIVLLTTPSSGSSFSPSPEATPHNSAPSVAPVIGVGYMGAQAGWSF
ncbi:MAG TPA: tetratricopeptide repeat protein [Polyangia bacterium]|nr:tetratricopeptide repeat protein [Polyangia bacterium]